MAHLCSNAGYQATQLYAFGSNGSGQLGIGHTEDVPIPQLVLGMPRASASQIKNIACGGNHTVALFNDDSLGTTGDNSDGRCFRMSGTAEKDFTHAMRPSDRLTEPKHTIQHIAATWSSTVVALASGQLLTCGTGNSGELGLGTESKVVYYPTVIEDFPPQNAKVVKIASCMGHVVVVLSNGEVWGWGKGRQGQLGTPLENKWKPSKIEGVSFFVVDAVCGKDFTCIFGHPSSGQLFMLGPNGKDRFGVKANAPASLPNWKQVSASWGSIFVLTESGQVIAWGRDDHGQLPPRSLPALKSVAAGSEHCIALTEAGKVSAWGWGEHGNCGQHTDSDGDVKERWNEVDIPHPVSAVYAGCATSFLVAMESSQKQSGTCGTSISKANSLGS